MRSRLSRADAHLPTMASRLFVYYRVREAALPSVLVEVQALQADLMAAHPGLNAELLRRPELRDGELTLMEAYAGGDVTAWTMALASAVAARPALPVPRHAEAFDNL